MNLKSVYYINLLLQLRYQLLSPPFILIYYVKRKITESNISLYRILLNVVLDFLLYEPH